MSCLEEAIKRYYPIRQQCLVQRSKDACPGRSPSHETACGAGLAAGLALKKLLPRHWEYPLAVKLWYGKHMPMSWGIEVLWGVEAVMGDTNISLLSYLS